MTTRRLFLAGFAAAAAAAYTLYPAPRPAAAADPLLTEAEFAAVRAAVRPAPGEDAFAAVPWQTSLHDARVLAAKEGKPILLWEMDGHPLGCG